MYWIILACVLFGLFRYDFSSATRGRKFLFYFILFLVIITSAFAFNLGSDAPGYKAAFDAEVPTLRNIKDAFGVIILQRWSFGFLFLMSACKSIIPSFYFFKLIYACILNGSIFSFFWNNSKHVFLALLFYLTLQGFYFNFEVLREGLALSVFIWAYPCIARKEWKKYYLLCLVAVLFHTSAVILFFVPLVRFLKVGSKRTLWIMFLLIVALLVISSQMSSIFMKILSFGGSIGASYFSYLRDDFYTSNRLSLTSLTTYATLLVDVIMPTIMLYVFSRKGINKDYYPLIIISVLLIIPSKSLLILYRFTNYFYVFTTVFYIDMFKYLCRRFISRHSYFPYILFCYIYIGYFFIQKNFSVIESGLRGIDRYYPYVFATF